MRKTLQTKTGGHLTEYASQLPGMPRIRMTLYETEDVNPDVIMLQQVRAAIEAYPGGNQVQATIRTLDGQRVPIEWRALACRELRQSLSRIMSACAICLALFVDRSTFTCRRCKSTDLAYDIHGRPFCPACVVPFSALSTCALSALSALSPRGATYPTPDPGQCHACKQTEWRPVRGGGRVCATCHPAPAAGATP